MATGSSRVVRRTLPLIVLLGVSWVVFSIAGSAKIEPADFTFNNATEVQTLDPATVTGVPEGRVMKALFEGLTVKDPKTLEARPGSAESWEVSDSGLVYTFRIRDNAHWTNGDPVTAHDFVYSWERFLNPMTGADYAYQLWYVKGARDYTTQIDNDGKPNHSFDTVGVEAPDDRTLVVTLESPTPFFLDLMGFYPMFPVNRNNIESAKEQWPDNWELKWLQPENIVTNGPYLVGERRVNDRIRLIKNESYWDADNVAFNTIDVLAIEQQITGLNVYLDGGSQLNTNIPSQLVRDLLKREDFNPKPYLGTYFYRVSVNRPPMDDVRVRRALALCIDRQAITEKVTKSGQIPSYAFVPPGISGYSNAVMPRAPGSTGDLRADYEEAKRLLDEAGYGPSGRPFPTIEVHYNTMEMHKAIAEQIADTWKTELGISAKLLNQEWKVYLDTQSSKNYDVSRSAWIGDYGDPNTFLDLFVTGGENNKTGWGNAEYDASIAAAASEFDPVKRMQHFHRAEEILMEELPILPIYFYVTQNIFSPRIGGYFDNVQDEHFPKFFYWMDDAEVCERYGWEPNSPLLSKYAGPSGGMYSPAEMRARAGAGQ
ncbi:MAG: oligopeptide transport system substrate-binding protein [Planctomycetota bacterium]|jgi:oligopeptide transport system substrate-binding protein